MASFSYAFFAKRNGVIDSQFQKWEFIHIAEDGIVKLDDTSLLWHIGEGIGPGYTRIEESAGAGTPLIVDPAGTWDVLNHPPPTAQTVTDLSLNANIAFQVCCGVMVLEDDDYVEIGQIDAPGIVTIPSFKIVRIGIGNFL